MANFYGQYIGFGAGVSGAVFQGWGESYGYAHQGYVGSGDETNDKFSLASGTQNGTATVTLSVARSTCGSSSSATHGYQHGGRTGGAGTETDIIDRFDFSSDSSSSDVGDLFRVMMFEGGTMSTTHGYTHGGYIPDAPQNFIEKYAHASSATSEDIGDLVGATYLPASAMSSTKGYSMGGVPSGGYSHNSIQSYLYASDGNATDVSDMSTGHTTGSGTNSDTSGYCAGGDGNAANSTDVIIDKFSFASDGDGGSNIGNLSVARSITAGVSSKTFGYCVGGATTSNVIDKYDFSSDGSASDVGDISTGDECWGGHQV